MNFKPGDKIIYLKYFMSQTPYKVWVVRRLTNLGSYILDNIDGSGQWTGVKVEEGNLNYRLLSKCKSENPELFI